MDLSGLWGGPFPTGSTIARADETSQDLEGLVFGEEEVQELSPLDGSGASTPTLVSSDSSSIETNAVEATLRRKPMPRKGHKKSRRGCYSCKRRKIKCPETKPSCDNCVRAGITCDYPKPAEYQLVLASPTAPLSTSPTSFSMEDMRFFHHFIVRGYPHLPLGADHTWTMEMPAIAHQYDYLMKAMLALGASHLDLVTRDDVRQQALVHRVDAVKLLNKALSRPAVSTEEADARFAAFMVLTFQSTCMPEGLSDFLTMLRGCILNGHLSEDSFFNTFTENRHFETVIDRLGDAEIQNLDTKVLGESVSSLAKFEALCKTDTEKKYHSVLMDVAVMGYSSPKKAYLSFVGLYNMVGVISHNDFQSLIDTTNPVSQLLLSHFLASHVILRHISIYEMADSRSKTDPSPMYQVMMGWMHKIHAALPPDYKVYNEWACSFVMKWAPVIVSEKAWSSDASANRLLIARKGAT